MIYLRHKLYDMYTLNATRGEHIECRYPETSYRGYTVLPYNTRELRLIAAELYDHTIPENFDLSRLHCVTIYYSNTSTYRS